SPAEATAAPTPSSVGAMDGRQLASLPPWMMAPQYNIYPTPQFYARELVQRAGSGSGERHAGTTTGRKTAPELDNRDGQLPEDGETGEAERSFVHTFSLVVREVFVPGTVLTVPLLLIYQPAISNTQQYVMKHTARQNPAARSLHMLVGKNAKPQTFEAGPPPFQQAERMLYVDAH
ncbi:unnamed protein product, partial [Tilletia caries]